MQTITLQAKETQLPVHIIVDKITYVKEPVGDFDGCVIGLIGGETIECNESVQWALNLMNGF